jgi:hypothetical protein
VAAGVADEPVAVYSEHIHGDRGMNFVKVGGLIRATRGPLVRAATAGATMIEVPALVTVPNIEILEVGEDWETSTGVFTWDEEDIASAVASQDDPAVRTPVIKLGHTDPRFDGQPSFGRLENLHVANNDQTLISDYVSMPGWLAACLESAYPRRSIEGYFDVTTRTGNEWPFVLTAIALLGETYPAITTLEDIKAIWGGETPTLVPADELEEVLASRETQNGTFFVAMKEDEVRWKRRNEPVAAATRVQAGTTVDDVRRTFYDTIGDEPGHYWWWIRAVMIEPAQIIVDDDEGHLYRIEYSVQSNAVIFGDPVEVEIEYVDVAASTGAAPDGTQVRIGSRYADAAASGRPERPPRTEGSQPPSESTTVPPEQEENGMQLSDETIRSLGLDPATATEAEVLERFNQLTAQNEGGGEGGDEGGDGDEGGGTETTSTTDTQTPGDGDGEGGEGGGEDGTETPTTPEGTTVPEGMVLVDAAAWENVRQTTTAMATRLEQDRIAARDRTIADAVRAGKIEKARMKFWTEKWEADPDGTKATLASLQPVLPITEIGELGGEEDPAVAAAAYPSAWGPTVVASQKGTAGSVKVVND